MRDIIERLRFKGAKEGEKSNHMFRRLHIERIEAAAEIARLREALRRYGDKGAMSRAPAGLQETIDAAISENTDA